MTAVETRLWLLQRATALVMAPLVFGHLALIVYAVQGGLSAEEILSRTRGSVFWAAFYGVFVLAAAVEDLGSQNEEEQGDDRRADVPQVEVEERLFQPRPVAGLAGPLQADVEARFPPHGIRERLLARTSGQR